MTLDELKTALKRYGFDDSDPLETWLNAAKDDLVESANWPWLMVRSTIVVAAGIGSFSLPSDGLRPVSIRNQTVGLAKLEMWPVTRWEREIDDFTAQGTPMYYTIFNVGGSNPSGTPVAVEVWPIPDVTTTFRLVYEAAISDLVNPTDEPFLPRNLHYGIVQRAASIALQAENEEDRAQTAQGEFEATLNRALTKGSSLTLDEPQAVVDVMGYN